MKEKTFFEWVVSLFKKPAPIVVEKTFDQIQFEEARRSYRLEYLETEKCYFVQFFTNDQWFYLRKWEDDYTYERARGNGMRLRDPNSIDNIIRSHQDWISEGHKFINFD